MAEITKSLHRCGLSGKSALAWVSGGVDSVCLARLLAALRDAGGLAHLEIAHVNHNLRPDSGADAEFVRVLAETLGAPFHLLTLTEADFPGGTNVQAAARLARREGLEKLRLARGLDFSALAHHADDQAETVLFKLLRGVGPRGAGGIREWSPPLLRPLLNVTKAELLMLAAREGWEYREDQTNAKPKYSRNRVRNELLPLAREIAPGADGALVRFAALVAEDDDCLTTLAHGEFSRLATEEPEGYRFEAAALAVLHPALMRRLLLAAVEKLGLDASPLSMSHLAAVAELLAPGRAHRKAPVPGPVVFARSYGNLWVYDPARLAKMVPETLTLEELERRGIKLGFPEGRPVGEVTFRPWKPGDRIGDKKVKDILMEAGIPRWRRELAVIVEDVSGVLSILAIDTLLLYGMLLVDD